MKATAEHGTAKIAVWWDMKDCPIPEGYDAGRVRASLSGVQGTTKHKPLVTSCKGSYPLESL
ncbi:hypothetical protein HID58_059516 [Brassica napus]|uniref:NYN domain-containing protein n=1 Tax=Brassica napus TaxID=3708 RepID=A0ABQ7ZU21_BRANA|nr:hypothetical protein HID58_059516 [Brassica napus]